MAVMELIRVGSRKRQKGFTLLEVLVAMAIVAVGYLGLLSVQVNALRFLQIASSEGRAALLGHNLAERINANPGGAHYISTDEFGPGEPDQWHAAPVCQTQACTVEQRAYEDMAEWITLSRESLPGFAGGTLRRVTPGGKTSSDLREFIITLYWHVDRPHEQLLACSISGFERYACWQMRLGVR